MEAPDGTQGKAKKDDRRTWGSCHKTEETITVPCDLKREKQRSVAGRRTQMVCRVLRVLSVVNGSIVSVTSLIIKI